MKFFFFFPASSLPTLVLLIFLKKKQRFITKNYNSLFQISVLFNLSLCLSGPILNKLHSPLPMRGPGSNIGVGGEQRARGGVVSVMRGGVQRRVAVAGARAHLPARRHQRLQDPRAAFWRRQVDWR